MADSASQTGQHPRYQRSIKNYLLDPAFQLKYTGYLVVVAVSLSGILGALLWRTSEAVMAQSRTAVTQGIETVKRGQELVKTSQDLSKVVKMNIADKYADDPETAQLFSKGADEKAAQLEAEQKRLEAEATRLGHQARDLEGQQQSIMITLIAGLSALVVLIALAGIVITHKIAGPIFKMKRQIRELGEGHLRMPGRLRKGDELVHFFETFEETVKNLRSRQEEEIRKLDEAIGKIGDEPSNRPAIESLRALRASMQAQLE